jgi:hypothetical protein
METVDTHSDVKVLLLKYLRGRGSTPCLECVDSLDLPPILREYASAQDIIGWDNFVMEMISHRLLPIQRAHFHTAGKSYCTTRWIVGLITQLLQVTHTQWMYQCMLVHDHTTGVLISTHKADLLKEIEHQLSLGPDDLTKQDRFVLECKFANITSTSGETQGYWLLGIQAAREALRIHHKRQEEAQIRQRKRQRRV